MPPSTADRPSALPPRRKGTLFCQSCWHESPADGDWRVQATTDGTYYRCPDCGATVADRSEQLAVLPRSPRSSDTRDSPVARSIRLALAWSVWPCRFPDGLRAISR